jgi:hypothetical protein
VRENDVLGTEERILTPASTDPGHRNERSVANHGTDRVEEVARRLVAVVFEGPSHLDPAVPTAGHLQVPARVVAAGSASQGDPATAQVQAGRVEVDGLQVVLDGLSDGEPRRLVDQVREDRRRLYVVLALDLLVTGRGHDPSSTLIDNASSVGNECVGEQDHAERGKPIHGGVELLKQSAEVVQVAGRPVRQCLLQLVPTVIA